MRARVEKVDVLGWNKSKSYICIEETNQRINEFSFGYMMNPTLFKNRDFKEQVKVCFRNTFVPDTASHTNKILVKKYKSASISYFYDSGKTIIRKLSRVLSCVIYTIIYKYVCIDYLGTEKKKISDLKIGCKKSSKHDGMDYNNLFGIGIPNKFL